VAKGPKFRFYAGLPLLGSRREVIGTLSVYDLQARSLSADDLQALRDLADIAEKELLSIELLDAQAQLVQKLGATRRRASLDALTRVWTRAAGEALLRVALEQSMQRRTPIAVGMLDIDHFKNINDEFGHPTGDRVLQHAVKAVVGALRDQDTICRWGGDEFLLILEDVSQEDLAAIAARIRERVRLSKIRIQTGLIPITVSVGITVAIPDGDSLEIGGWLERADLALLRCKKRGRDAVVIDAPSRPPEQTRFANTTTATLAGQ
jgi:diguanylate cyclase (GGDEF)-like protein